MKRTGMTGESLSPVDRASGGCQVERQSLRVHVEPFAPALVAARDARRRRQVSHDLRHGLATVAKLVEAIAAEPGLADQVFSRVRNLEIEVQRLAGLLEEELAGNGEPRRPETLVRIDSAAREVVEILAGTTGVDVRLDATPVQGAVSLTGLWRAVRNLVDNAIRAASPRGAVEVRVFSEGGFAVIEVDDSGPGFGLVAGGLSSLGLGIVQDFVSLHDGSLGIAQGSLGGCCVRICLPAVPLLDLVEGESARGISSAGVG